MLILRIALPVPMRQCFDYLCSEAEVAIGARVLVPFGARQLIGVVTELPKQADIATSELKSIDKLLDDIPVFDTALLQLCQWLASYYHHPLGLVLSTAMPAALRKGQSAQPDNLKIWRITKQGNIALSSKALQRAPKQQALLAGLQPEPALEQALKAQFSMAIIRTLLDKGLIEEGEQAYQASQWQFQQPAQTPLKANVDQALAISAIVQSLEHFKVGLLEGITGSGKTEVYLQCIEPVLAKGQQVLILVPEIGLTPQMIARFEERFALPIGILHSNLNDNQRLRVWQQAKSGELAMVIGTRSAIFTPMKSLGMILVDEEHDSSFKQQDGLRYNARDAAIIRAKQQQIPVVLGSATPSLESLHNAQQGKFAHWPLRARAGKAQLPKINLLDLKEQPLTAGIAHGLIQRMGWHLEQGNQVLVFLNRRGYAPALLCHHCGQVEQCRSCERPYTLHKSLHKLHCHHCGSVKRVPQSCSHCGSQTLDAEGIGTERLEQALIEAFPQYPPIRIDSDSVKGKDALNNLLEKVHKREHRLLVGTQILAKGHHFPHVTLVVILGVDAGLFSADFRAQEKLAQLIVQLSGRAGRADKPGEIWLQTHDPSHPMLQDLVHNGYQDFARSLLQERAYAQLPPFQYQALLRAEANQMGLAQDFLSAARNIFSATPGLQLLGPKPALMEKRQGRYRMQLILQAAHRGALQQSIQQTMPSLEKLPQAKKVRWSLDMDPQDFM